MSEREQLGIKASAAVFAGQKKLFTQQIIQYSSVDFTPLPHGILRE